MDYVHPTRLRRAKRGRSSEKERRNEGIQPGPGGGVELWGGPAWVALRKGKAVTDIWLAQRLRQYGLRPKTIWIGETAAKGYLEEDFNEAFRRYVPESAAQALLDNVRAEAQKPGDGQGEA